MTIVSDIRGSSKYYTVDPVRVLSGASGVFKFSEVFYN
ncbi:unnamed protein product, partial [marine sediment metagenome]